MVAFLMHVLHMSYKDILELSYSDAKYLIDSGLELMKDMNTPSDKKV